MCNDDWIYVHIKMEIKFYLCLQNGYFLSSSCYSFDVKIIFKCEYLYHLLLVLFAVAVLLLLVVVLLLLVVVVLFVGYDIICWFCVIIDCCCNRIFCLGLITACCCGIIYLFGHIIGGCCDIISFFGPIIGCRGSMIWYVIWIFGSRLGFLCRWRTWRWF